MPAIPEPTRIVPQEPGPVQSTSAGWNEGPSQPVDLLAVPPFDQWPVFAPKPERVWPAREALDDDRTYAAKCYSFAMHWFSQDQVERRKEVEALERKERNRAAVAKYRAKNKALHADNLTGEAANWHGEIQLINAYVKKLDTQIHELRKQRETAMDRHYELVALLTAHVAERDRK